MNTAVTIMQAVDWKKYSLENWLRQFGAWCEYSYENKLVMAKATPAQKLSQEQREVLIAHYMNNGSCIGPIPKKKKDCLINDNEARAVQRMWLDLNGNNNEILKGWLNIVWLRYVEQKSFRDISKELKYPIVSIQQDVKCGIAHISGRNPHLRVDLLSGIG